MKVKDISRSHRMLSIPGDRTPFAEDLVEMPLLLTGAQAAALEAEARQRGLTTAQLLRQLIREVTDQGY